MDLDALIREAEQVWAAHQCSYSHDDFVRQMPTAAHHVLSSLSLSCFG